MQYVVDRFEEDKAVLEDIQTRERLVVDASLLPPGAAEGSVVTLENGTMRHDPSAGAERAKRVAELMDSVFE